MTRFAILEAEKHEKGTSGKEAEGTTVKASHRDTRDDGSTPITVVSSTPASGRQETMGEVGQDDTEGRDEPVTMPLSGESLQHTTIHRNSLHGPG